MSTLEIRDLVVRYGTRTHPVDAVGGVNLSLGDASIVGLVGESGSGKSTLAKAIVGLAPIHSGEILLDGELLRSSAHKSRPMARSHRRRIQLVFQDPYASLNPRMKIAESVAEGLTASGGSRAWRTAEVGRLLELVRLDPGRSHLLPRDLSGGQRQRVAIARALAARPDILIADEITSALDVSVQGAALNLVRDIQRETGIGVLFISHNLAIVRYLAQAIAVMHNGQIVESGTTAEVTERPQHQYTQSLLSAVPSIRAARTSGLSSEART